MSEDGHETTAWHGPDDELPGGPQARPAADPLDPAFAAPAAEQAGVDELAVRARQMLGEVETELAKIAGALERLEDGRYGSCEVCGQPIGDALLQQDPTRARCDEHG